jgi:hypothetical protein
VLVAHTVILATQKVEIRKVEVGSQTQQMLHETLPQKYQHKTGLAERLKW